MKTSKVKSVQANGTYDSNYGLLYKYEYEFEDGTVLTANHKSQNPFPVGEEIEYEVKGTNEYGSWGKVSKPKENGYGGNSYKGGGKSNSVSAFALSYAKDWCLGLHSNGNPQTPDNVLAVAEKFNEWLKTHQ